MPTAVAPQVCVPLPPWAMRAGARETIYYNPAEVNVAIVTCGGLCPGLNDVVLGLVHKLTDYGVPEGNILGIRCAPCDLVTRPCSEGWGCGGHDHRQSWTQQDTAKLPGQ
jgi:hypothetical protein